MSERRQRAVVIGGGVAGLAAAALLARAGHAVTLLEAQNDLGGRAGVWETDGFRFDTGPSWYLMPEVFEHFYRLMGTSADQQLNLVELDPGYRAFFQDRPDPIDVRRDRAENIALFERAEPGAGRRLDAYLHSAEETYRLAVDRFLYNTFASPRRLAAPAVARRAGRLALLLGRSLDRHIAARFADPRLRQILGYPAVFLGAAPSMAPSLYHLMSYLDLADGVRYPMGGLAQVVASLERLARAAGAQIRTGTEATEILTGPGFPRPQAVAVAFTAPDGTRVREPADIVVSAADLHHTETELVPEGLRTYPQKWWDSRVPGPGAVLALLGVRGALPQLAHHNLFFTADWKDNFDRIFTQPTSVPDPASAYVCKASATDPEAAPAGCENLFILIPVPSDPGIGRGGLDRFGAPAVEAAADRAIEQVSRWAGVPGLADRIVVRRTLGPADFARDLHSWRGTALGPAHTLRQSAFLRAGNKSAKIDGLYYAGAGTIPGVGVPMCLISAELALKRIRGDTSAGPLPEPLAPEPGTPNRESWPAHEQ